MKEGERERELKNRYFENTIWLKISKARKRLQKPTEKLENARQLVVGGDHW